MYRIAAILAVLLIGMSAAEARPRHHHHHRQHHMVQIAAPSAHPDCNVLWPCFVEPLVIAPVRRHYAHARATPRTYSAPTPSLAYSASALVERARRYMGGNPTGWRHVWCGRFMAMIAPEAAARIRNPNMARDWVGAGRASNSCQVGTVAVLSRGRRGGHVGVVSACTAYGPQIVSGNHGHRVGEGVYPAGRVLAYVTI